MAVEFGVQTHGSNTPHGVMDSARAKTTLNDLETTTFTENHVLGGHTHVLKGDVTVTVGCVIVAKDTQHAVDGDARGVVGDENDGLLLVGTGVVSV